LVGKIVTAITLFGSSGRMGEAIADIIAHRDDIHIVEEAADVYIDFSAPDALRRHLDIARADRRPIVIGTTGFGDEHFALIDAAARDIAVLHAPNMSLGVNMLAFLVRETAAKLGPDWDIEIVELHHRNKVDAPSGTALLLGESAAEARGVDLGAVSDRGRDGMTGPRTKGHIGFAVIRGGTAAGEHQVLFAGDRERIELCHRAESREVFARGAVQAALWLADKPAGRYDIAHVLGLR
jgi:4-hydroxy-tetrahydrodipicolinate reductase